MNASDEFTEKQFPASNKLIFITLKMPWVSTVFSKPNLISSSEFYEVFELIRIQ